MQPFQKDENVTIPVDGEVPQIVAAAFEPKARFAFSLILQTQRILQG